MAPLAVRTAHRSTSTRHRRARAGRGQDVSVTRHYETSRMAHVPLVPCFAVPAEHSHRGRKDGLCG